MRSTACRAMLVLMLASVGLVGCASGGYHPLRRTGLLIEPEPARELGYVVNWAGDLKVTDQRRLVAAKVLGDELVTVEEPGRLVTAVSIDNGKILWRRVIDGASARLHAPARSGDLILVNTDTRLYLLNARTGEIEHVQDLGDVVAGGPAVIDGVAVFGSVNGIVFGQDIRTGLTRWRYKLTSSFHTPPITVSGGTVFAADGNGVYAMLGAANGTLRWRGHAFGPVVAPPAVGRGIYVPSRDRSLYALNTASGTDQWIYRGIEPLTMRPMVMGTAIVLPVPGQGVIALEASDGKVRWQLKQTALPIAQRGDNALLATSQSLLLVDLNSGRIVDQAKTRELKTVLQGPKDSLILISPQGEVLRLNPLK